MPEQVAALILDFDGVVVESNAIKTVAFDAVFRRFPEHHAVMMSFHHANVALPRGAKFAHLATNLLGRSADDPIVQELAHDFSHQVRDEITRCPFVSGAEEFLREFCGAVPLYLASVTPEPELRHIISRRRLNRYFSGIFGDPPNDKRAAIGAILEREQIHPRNAVLIGDSPGDVAAARDMGVQFVGRESGIPLPKLDLEVYPDMHAVAAAIRERVVRRNGAHVRLETAR